LLILLAIYIFPFGFGKLIPIPLTLQPVLTHSLIQKGGGKWPCDALATNLQRSAGKGANSGPGYTKPRIDKLAEIEIHCNSKILERLFQHRKSLFLCPFW
jgi:hypothetical protein